MNDNIASERFVTWRQLLILSVSCSVSCIAIPIGVTLWVFAVHQDSPHVGAARMEDTLEMRRRLERIEDKLDNYIFETKKTLDNPSKVTLI